MDVLISATTSVLNLVEGSSHKESISSAEDAFLTHPSDNISEAFTTLQTDFLQDRSTVVLVQSNQIKHTADLVNPVSDGKTLKRHEIPVVGRYDAPLFLPYIHWVKNESGWPEVNLRRPFIAKVSIIRVVQIYLLLAVLYLASPNVYFAGSCL